jgi:hypothetical protein
VSACKFDSLQHIIFSGVTGTVLQCRMYYPSICIYLSLYICICISTSLVFVSCKHIFVICIIYRHAPNTQAQSSIEAAQSTPPISSRLRAQHNMAVESRTAAKEFEKIQCAAAKDLEKEKKQALKVRQVIDMATCNETTHLYIVYIYMI